MGFLMCTHLHTKCVSTKDQILSGGVLQIQTKVKMSEVTLTSFMSEYMDE